MSEARHSQALEAELIRDPKLRAQQKAQNGLKQFQVMTEMVEYFLIPTGRSAFVPRTCRHCTAPLYWAFRDMQVSGDQQELK